MRCFAIELLVLVLRARNYTKHAGPAAGRFGDGVSKSYNRFINILLEA